METVAQKTPVATDGALHNAIHQLVKTGHYVYQIYGGGVGQTQSAVLLTSKPYTIENDEFMVFKKDPTVDNTAPAFTSIHDLRFLSRPGELLFSFVVSGNEITDLVSDIILKDGWVEKAKPCYDIIAPFFKKGDGAGEFAKRLGDILPTKHLKLDECYIHKFTDISLDEINRILGRLEYWIANSPWDATSSKSMRSNIGIAIFLDGVESIYHPWYELVVDDLCDDIRLLRLLIPRKMLDAIETLEWL